jgi:hypothetical protein
LVAVSAVTFAGPAYGHHTKTIFETAKYPHRLLVVCGTMEMLKSQLEEIDTEEYWNRQLIIVTVLEDGAVAVISPGETPSTDGKLSIVRGDPMIARKTCEQSPSIYNLVDKDRSVIGEWQLPVETEVLVRRIDSNQKSDPKSF